MNRTHFEGARLAVALLVCVAGTLAPGPSLAAGRSEESDAWNIARKRGAVYADCGRNTRRLLQAWIDLKRDPKTHLYTRGRTWDYHDEAADHYSSLVLVACYVAPELNEPGGTLHQTLVNSQKLCATPSGIPTTYDLKTHAQGRVAGLGHLSEWLRDGLIRIVEIKGTENDWYRELDRLTTAMIAEAGRQGGMVKAFRGTEPWGNMLETLARLYAMSGKEQYLQAAEQIADAILLDPRWKIRKVTFRDHGCELVPGLSELFVLECKLSPRRPKARQYHKPMRELLDGILESGAHPETGLLCGFTKADDGTRRWLQPPDTWGYVLFSFENYDRGTGENRYTAAIEKPMRWLVANYPNYPKLKTTLWPATSNADTWSDSHESMIVLWKRYPQVEGVFEWLDWATHQHVHRRQGGQKYGPYTGNHFDGSTGRCLSIHMMFCSQGVRTVPFAEGLRLGGVGTGDELLLALETDTAWRGKLCFDGPRTEHKVTTIDWARLNEMPQWFVARPDKRYSVTIDGAPPTVVDGKQLIQGLPIDAAPGTPRKIRIRPVR